MPTVPRISTPEVQQSRAPNVALQGNADPRAFGAGVGQALGEVAKVAKDSYDLQIETQVKSQRSALVQWELDNVDNPTTGAMSTKGVDALGVHEKVMPDLDKRVGELEDGIRSPRGKQIFRQMADSFRQDVTRKLNTHAERQGSIYAKEQTDATLALSMEAAAANAGDPNRVANELKYSVGVVMADSKRLGMSPEATKERLLDTTTGIHAAVLDSMLTAGSYSMAKAYFDANGQDMNVKVREQAGQQVKQGYARVEGKQAADELFRKHGQDFTSVNAGLKDIEDPMVRDVAETEVTQERERRDAAKRARHDQNLNDATNVVERTGDFNSIPPSMLADLSVHERSALKAYAKQKAGGAEPTEAENATAYKELSDMLVDDPEKFAALDLTVYLPRLGRVDFQKMQDRQTKYRTNPTDPEFASIKTTKGRVRERMDQVFAIDSSSKKLGTADKERVQQFESEFERRQAEFKEQNGRVANTKDSQGILDEMTISIQMKRSRAGMDWLAGDQEIPAYQLKASEVPTAERAQIEEALRASGRPVTDAAITSLYARMIRATGQ